MRILFFSSIFWLLILAIVAIDEGFSAVCKFPRTKLIRQKKRYVTLEDFLRYDSCRKDEHEDEISRKIEQLNEQHAAEIARKDKEIEYLKDQLFFNGDNYDDDSYIRYDDYPESTTTESTTTEAEIAREDKGIEYLKEELDIYNDDDYRRYDDYPETTTKFVTSSDCNTGFHFATDHCEQNVCTCQNGEPKTGIDCVAHGKEDCSSTGCNKGFHFDSDLCEENRCTCYNGEPNIGIDCIDHGWEDCNPSGCNSGYHFRFFSYWGIQENKGDCEQNFCTCQNGEPQIGINCTTHGKEDCISSSCNRGFYFTSKRCLQNDWKQAGETSVYFKVLDYRMELTEAHSACLGAYPGSRLATILSQTEFDLIKSFEFKSDHTYGHMAWVDLTASGDIGDRSNWYWGNGKGLVNQSDHWWFESVLEPGDYAPWSKDDDSYSNNNNNRDVYWLYSNKHGAFREQNSLHNQPGRSNPAICELRL